MSVKDVCLPVPVVTWSQIQPPSGSEVPSRRALHGLVAIDPYVYLYGGSDLYDRDLWRIDVLSARVWQRLAIPGGPTTPRSGHGMCTVGQRIFVFGGLETGTGTAQTPGVFYNELWTVDMSALSPSLSLLSYPGAPTKRQF